jgi:hypothetical protein
MKWLELPWRNSDPVVGIAADLQYLEHVCFRQFTGATAIAASGAHFTVLFYFGSLPTNTAFNVHKFSK